MITLTDSASEQSAVMAGLKVVPVKSLPDGSLDLVDLKEKAEKHKDKLAAFMITYPSTFGVFEAGVQDVSLSSSSKLKVCFLIRCYRLARLSTTTAVKFTWMVRDLVLLK